MLPLVGWPPHCVFRAVTGVPCPFCGMTTAMLALSHGDIGGALAANPGAPLLAVAFVVLALTRFGEFGRAWRAVLTETAGRWGVRRWTWPALGGMWVFELHRFAVR